MKKVTCAALSLFFLMLTASEAYSCSCREVTQREEFGRSGAVFVGKYANVSKDNGKVIFKVEKSWKGVKAGEIVSLMYWDLEGCDNDLNLVKGKKYLIYAVPSERGLFISVDCGRSRAIKDAREDIKNMGKVVATRNKEGGIYRAQPNNGMHPTANSGPLIARLVGIGVVCAAGDAGR